MDGIGKAVGTEYIRCLSAVNHYMLCLTLGKARA